MAWISVKFQNASGQTRFSSLRIREKTLLQIMDDVATKKAEKFETDEVVEETSQSHQLGLSEVQQPPVVFTLPYSRLIVRNAIGLHPAARNSRVRLHTTSIMGGCGAHDAVQHLERRSSIAGVWRHAYGLRRHFDHSFPR